MWSVIVSINGGLQAVGYALPVLFFVMGVVKTCGSTQRPPLNMENYINPAVWNSL